MLFFLRFRPQARDGFFLLFALAVDAVTPLLLGLMHVSQEAEPLFCLARLPTFALIIAAIVQKTAAASGCLLRTAARISSILVFSRVPSSLREGSNIISFVSL